MVTIEATLNIAGDSAGTKNTLRELSIPMQAAASATSSRNGATMRVSTTVSSNLPGTSVKAPASRCTSGSAKTMAATTSVPVTRINAFSTELPSCQARSRPSMVRALLKVGTSAALIAPSANRSRSRLGTRNATRNASMASPAPNQ